MITLGTPFAASHRSTHARRLYELACGRKIAQEAARYDLPAAPPVPTTSIYSRSDGIVAWQGSIQAPDADNSQTENIEVRFSHLGLGFNPSAWWALADRLAQAESEWQPFQPPQARSKAGFTGWCTRIRHASKPGSAARKAPIQWVG